MPKMTALFFIMMMSLWGTEFYKPSFNCAKVKQNSTEYKICTDKKLARLDNELSMIYSSFYFLSDEIKKDQRRWIKERNECKDDNCIYNLYVNRIDELNISLFNQNTFPKDVLDAMKEAQKTLQLTWDPIIFDKQHIEAGTRFKDDLFRFRRIHFKKPLVDGVQYDDVKLKEILETCYDYRFDLQIGRYPRNLIEDNQKYYQPEKRIPIKEHLYFSVWKIAAQSNEWFFIKMDNTNISAYLVETNLCKQAHLNDSLVQALNNKSTQIKASQFSLNNPYVVNYKNQELIFDLFLIRNDTVELKMFEVLGVTSSEDPTTQFTGTWLAIIPFKK